MCEKPFNCVLDNDYHIINNNVDNMTYFLQDGNDVVLVINLLNKLYEDNEQLKKQLNKYDKLKISIFNKDKGDWKWNDNNDIILNIRNGKSFYLRNSGAVENLVDLLNELAEENELLKSIREGQQQMILKLYEENKQLRMKLKGDDYIMVSEMLSNLRKTGICDDCKNKDKPVEWYLERGFSITGRVCDRYEPE